MESEELFNAAHINPKKHKDTAFIAINHSNILDSNTVSGLDVKSEEIEDGVKLKMIVKKNTIIEKPVHLCFGMLHKKGTQNIILDFKMEKNSSIKVLAHCVFPDGEDVKHIMDGNIELEEGANYTYLEKHIHGKTGGVKVYPKAKVVVGKNAKFRTDFQLIKGRVGLIDIDYETVAHENAVIEMTSKINGKGNDQIKIKETGELIGKNSTGVLTSKIAVSNNAKAEVYNEIKATAENARGHVDCKEIMKDNAIAKAVPVVEVAHPKAHVTHEAAVGGVDNKQLETLMSRGLTEDEATDLIINGLLS
ncbi:MAG: SufB/SufD family protein [Nanoarchaeota archaeon]